MMKADRDLLQLGLQWRRSCTLDLVRYGQESILFPVHVGIPPIKDKRLTGWRPKYKAPKQLSLGIITRGGG